MMDEDTYGVYEHAIPDSDFGYTHPGSSPQTHHTQGRQGTSMALCQTGAGTTSTAPASHICLFYSCQTTELICSATRSTALLVAWFPQERERPLIGEGRHMHNRPAWQGYGCDVSVYRSEGRALRRRCVWPTRMVYPTFGDLRLSYYLPMYHLFVNG